MLQTVLCKIDNHLKALVVYYAHQHVIVLLTIIESIGIINWFYAKSYFSLIGFIMIIEIGENKSYNT